MVCAFKEVCINILFKMYVSEMCPRLRGQNRRRNEVPGRVAVARPARVRAAPRLHLPARRRAPQGAALHLMSISVVVIYHDPVAFLIMSARQKSFCFWTGYYTIIEKKMKFK